MFLRFEDIFTQGVAFNSEVKGGPTGSKSETEIRVAGCGAREEEKVGDAEGTSHGRVVS